MKKLVCDCLVLGGATGIVRGAYLLGGEPAAWLLGGAFVMALGLLAAYRNAPLARKAGPS